MPEIHISNVDGFELDKRPENFNTSTIIGVIKNVVLILERKI